MLMALNYTCNIQLEIFHFLICVDSKSVLYALQNWDYNVTKDIVYEVKYLIHCIMSRGIGIEFCSVLKNWDFKITGDIFHEKKVFNTLYHV